MFVDSKPTSLYSHSSQSSRSFIEMESHRAQLRRPPAALNHSSSSINLVGFENSIPSFQSFVQKTPKPNHEKPLPPVPNINTSDSSPISTRRTSSIYSRTVSQYAPTPESWRAEDRLAPSLFLQPSVYSLSTPELTLGDASETLLPPRPYMPLILSPSPSPSRKSTPSPPLEQRPSQLLSPPPPMLRGATQHIRTVSLDKAKAAWRSLGAQLLLPEEMRAMAAAKKAKRQTIRSSRSFEGVAPMRSPTLSDTNSSPSLPAPTPFDWPLAANPYSDKSGSKLSDEYFGTNNKMRLSLSPVETQLKSPIEISITRPKESLMSDYEPRGRLRIQSRTGSSRKVNECESKNFDTTEERVLDGSSNELLIDEAKRLANEYHDLFKADMKNVGFRKHSASSSSVKERMKLVPQPLFFNPRQISKQRTLQYQKELNSSSKFTTTTNKVSNPLANLRDQRSSPKGKERTINFPFKLSLTPESTGALRRRSTSGSIPISPPFARKSGDWCEPTKAKQLPSPVQRKNSIDDSNRFSAFYHRINADAEALAKEYSRPGNKVTFEMNTLPSILPTTSEETPHSSYSYGSPHGRRKASHDSGVSSAASSKASKAPLKSSMHKGIAAVTSVFGNHVRKPSVTAVEGLSNLVETFKQRRSSIPFISAPQPISVTEAFEASRTQSPPSPASLLAAKRPSLFSNISSHRRESKANKRREDLKRTIKMVPSGVPQAPRKDGEWL